MNSHVMCEQKPGISPQVSSCLPWGQNWLTSSPPWYHPSSPLQSSSSQSPPAWRSLYFVSSSHQLCCQDLPLLPSGLFCVPFPRKVFSPLSDLCSLLLRVPHLLSLYRKTTIPRRCLIPYNIHCYCLPPSSSHALLQARMSLLGTMWDIPSRHNVEYALPRHTVGYPPPRHTVRQSLPWHIVKQSFGQYPSIISPE